MIGRRASVRGHDKRGNNPRKPRVLNVVPLADPGGDFGGPLRVAVNLVGELNRRGFDALIAGGTFSGTRSEEIDGQPVRLFQARSLTARHRFGTLFSPSQAWWLIRNARSFQVIHVHAGRDPFSQLVLLICVLARTPFVVQTHGMVAPDRRVVVQGLDRLVVQPLLRRARAVLALNQREERELRELSGGRAHVVRLPNGVPTVAPMPPRPKGDTDRLEVLFLARLHPRKRPLHFVEMAGALLERGVEAVFVLVGPDEGCLAQVQQAIAQRGLGAAVRYEGALSMAEVQQRLSRADVYVLPSVDEPFPMSLLEAMSLGVASVCTTSCGIADVLAETTSALVVDDTVAALTDGVEALLKDETARKRLAAKGREVVERDFSVGAVVDRLELIYAPSAT